MKEKAVKATAWSGMESLGRQVIQFGSTVILARILSPEEFGTFALLALFLGIAAVIADSGLSSALVRMQNATHTDESTLFWTNVFLSLALGSMLAVAAPLLATFFNARSLLGLAPMMGLNIFLSSFFSIHSVLLSKQLNFRVLFYSGLVSSVAGCSVAIFGAWQGWGVYALATQALCGTAASVVFLWAWNPWRPDYRFSKSSFLKMWAYGKYLLASSLLTAVYGRLYSVLIGRFYGAADLGQYNRAYTLQQLPSNTIGGVLLRAAFPIFAAVSDCKETLRKGAKTAIGGISLVNSPVMLGLAAVADPMIVFLFGEQWIPAVPFLQVLAISGLLWPTHAINVNLLMAQGHSKLLFRIELLKKAIGISLIVAAAMHGLIWIAWTQVAISLVAFFLNSFFTKRFLAYGPLQQLVDILPALLVSGSMAAAVYFASGFLPPDMPAWLELSVLVPFGAVVYVLQILIFRPPAFRASLAILLAAYNAKR